jgi:hypothetical protein
VPGLSLFLLSLLFARLACVPRFRRRRLWVDYWKLLLVVVEIVDLGSGDAVVDVGNACFVSGLRPDLL